MNEVDCKFTSNNPVLITHKVSKILESAEKKIRSEGDTDPLKLPELNSLFTQCNSDNAVVSSVTCQALVCLVETGLLEVPPILSKFIAILGETRNYLPITSAICDLLKLDLKNRNASDEYTCPFSIKAPQHPLITVLMQKNTVWRDILGHMQSMIHQSDPKFLRHYIELLRPVFVYILCNPTLNLPESCKQQAWHVLIRTDETLHLQLEILQWLPMNDSNSCVDTSNRILELSEYLVASKNTELCTALLPLVAAVALDLLKHNCDPRANILMMETMIDYADETVGSIVMFLLSEIVEITPSVYLPNIIELGSMLLSKSACNETSSYSFMGSILPWMAYASLLSSEALKTAKSLISSITEKRDWPLPQLPQPSPLPAGQLQHSNPNYQFYSIICCHLSPEALVPWLERLSQAPAGVLLAYKHVLSGLFLQTSASPITSLTSKALSRISKASPDFALNVLSLVLHKLTKSKDISQTKEVLFTVPDLGISKENMPTIIHVLETLSSSDAPLKYVAIELYLKLWEVEPRCHRYLLSALITLTSNDSSFMGTVTCANAMKLICERRPEQGAELVPLLSQILNKCTSNTGSAASALALRGISALCVSGVADVCSTWRVLSPRMSGEKRTVVIVSICEFFGDIPLASSYLEDDFNELLGESLRKLWDYACHENMEIVEAAFKALASYKVQQMRVSHLPESFSAVPRSNGGRGGGGSEELLEEEPAYVPGACWVQMLGNVREQALSTAGDLLIKFINEELYSYRSGIYMWPMGEPVNFNYLPDKSPARSIGEYLRHYESGTAKSKFNIDGDPRHESNKSSGRDRVAVECMRIFSMKYPKALPPVQFSLLSDAINISDETRAYGVSLACHQAAVSPSAKEYLSKLLGEMSDCGSMSPQEFTKCWHVCGHLGDVCRGAASSVLGPFLDATINYIVERAIVDNDSAVVMFREVMKSFANILRDDLVLHDNKTIIGNILERLGDKVDVDHKIFGSIVEAMLELPTEQIERMTLPSVWEEVTTERLEKAIEIRGGLVMKRNNEIPLSWMNEMLWVCSTVPSGQRRLLRTLQRILGELRQEKSNAGWSWDLMRRIQASIVDADDDKSVKAAEFLCDALFVTIIVVTCDDYLLGEEGLVASSREVRGELFPHAVYRVSQLPCWKNIVQQIMEWLHLVRTSCLPATYKSIFHNALTSLKKELYLNEHWTRYLSVKSPLSYSVHSKD
ncbi:focadhesin [Diachasma alloeum]|uniref:focadhesin n=1 Tax=Diachasma alloeum TaxID=454923 RepID=UPI0007383776|nr:focadhesin [Diachasma alloeum]